MIRAVVRRATAVLGCLVAALAFAACGKKGPPLAPIHVVPQAVKEPTIRRTGDEVRIRFVLPTENAVGGGTIQLDRVEIYAVTVGPDSAAPPNRELLSSTYRIATLPVKPAPVEGEPPPEAPADTRPAPGEAVNYVETLTPETVAPAKLPPLPPPPPAAAGAPATPTPPPPTYAVRLYVVRGVTKGGRGGPPSSRLQMPLVDPAPPPHTVKPGFTEKTMTLAWEAPAGVASPLFNVYAPDGIAPLNGEPLSTTTFEQDGVEFGTERCYVVTTVETVSKVAIESRPSERACVTPKDIFPPAAPQRVTAVPSEGSMNLSWQANTEADLRGYVVLRGEAPGDTLQPLTAEPLASATYEDKTVKPGVRYVYVVVAVDKSGNTSSQSNRVEETAR